MGVPVDPPSTPSLSPTRFHDVVLIPNLSLNNSPSNAFENLLTRGASAPSPSNHSSSSSTITNPYSRPPSARPAEPILPVGRLIARMAAQLWPGERLVVARRYGESGGVTVSEIGVCLLEDDGKLTDLACMDAERLEGSNADEWQDLVVARSVVAGLDAAWEREIRGDMERFLEGVLVHKLEMVWASVRWLPERNRAARRDRLLRGERQRLQF